MQKRKTLQAISLLLTGLFCLLILGLFERLRFNIHSTFSLNERVLSQSFLGCHWLVERACIFAYLCSILLYQTNCFETLQKLHSGEVHKKRQQLYEFWWFLLFSILPIASFPFCLYTLKNVLRPESAYTLSLLLCAGFSLLITFHERKKKSTTIRGEELLTILHARKIPYSYFNTSAKDSVRWDIAKDANSPNRLIQLASILLPEEKNSTDSFWLRASRRLLVAIMSVFLHKFGEDWTFHDVIKASRLPKEELITFLRQYPDNEILIECLFSEEVEKAAANVKLDFIMHLDKLVPAAIHSQQATKSFSVSDFMKGEGVLLFGMDITEDEASKPLLHAVFNTLVNYINALPDKPPIRTFLYMEESFFLGEMPGLAKLIAFGRSKNAIVWLVLQCVSGFYKIYDENLAEFILSLCRHVIALRSTPKTAKYLSSLFGTVRIYKRSISDSLSQSGSSGGDQVREESTPKFLDSTFLNIAIPSKAKGLRGYFITPDSVEEKHISGEEVERLKAKRVPVPPDEPISKENQILLPWTAEEKKKFVYGEYTKGGENNGINTLNDFLDKEIAEYLVEFARKFVEEFKNGKEECN